jgi:hypothetical protein
MLDELKRVAVPADGPTIRLRGCDIPMSGDNEVFVQFVLDVARVVEKIKSADSVCESYGVEHWQRDVVENALLDRFVRNACEMRIRSGDAPREFAQHTMPDAMQAIRNVITDDKTAARDRVAAAKVNIDVAGAQGGIGVKSGYNIDIYMIDKDGVDHGLHLRDVVLYPKG